MVTTLGFGQRVRTSEKFDCYPDEQGSYQEEEEGTEEREQEIEGTRETKKGQKE